MIEFYPQIKGAHVGLVIASGALFAVRGAGVLSGGRWPLAWPVRWGSHAVDTALLTAALMLLTILPWGLFANGWLAAKLALLAVYIALGMFALHRARGRRARAACYAAALLTYLCAFGIARAHHPLGPLQMVIDIFQVEPRQRPAADQAVSAGSASGTNNVGNGS